LVVLDYFAYDDRDSRVWVPAGNLGVVAVIDGVTDKITTVGGFQTGEVELRGRKRVMGPSSASIGDGVVYIGNRVDANICVIRAMGHCRCPSHWRSCCRSITVDS